VEKGHLENLVTGDPKIAMAFDTTQARCVGEPYLMTEFDNAPFTRNWIGDQPTQTRQTISGLLVGGFGIASPRLLGVLYPEARRPFRTDYIGANTILPPER
jgi:hypothetical protein